MLTATGKSIVSGIAVGNIKIYRKPDRSISDALVEDREAELKRFEDAVETVIDQQNDLYDKAVEEAGEDNAAIFQVHAMMMEDDDLLDAVKDCIKEEGHSAEYAVRQSFEDVAHMFEEMENKYMRARSSDIRDLENATLDALMGIGPEGLQGTEPSILVADDLAPSETISLDKSLILGIVTKGGSTTSHTAILARTMNIPTIIQCQEIDDTWDGMTAVVDGYNSSIYVNPTADILKVMLERQEQDKKEEALLKDLKGKESVTVDGRKIKIYANIGGPEDVEAVLENDAEGVGLFRSEFVYLNTKGNPPSEEEQFNAYKEVLEALAPRKVVIRTCDIGADKQVGYMNLDQEANPAMGFRAIRICLTRKEFFKTQLRALLRASACGNLAVMFPMIISVRELVSARELMDECRKELEQEGVPTGPVEVGIMVETPAAVLIADDLAEHCDFFSIGTNDLTQYTLAVDRQNDKLDPFLDTHHPAVLKEIKETVEAGHRHGIWVGICGELGADRELTDQFLRMGVDELSVNPKSVLKVRKVVRGLDLSLPEKVEEENFH